MSNTQGLHPAIHRILESVQSPILTRGFLLGCLSDWRCPSRTISSLVRKGALLRLSRELFLLASHLQQGTAHPEIIANCLYGPSYVSLEWACQHYRLIPEGITTVTSCTTKRAKLFQTGAGNFDYSHVHQNAYSTGITQIRWPDGLAALIATREKALLDLIIKRRGKCTSRKEMTEILFDDLRVEPDDFFQLSRSELQMIHEAKPHSASRFILEAYDHE
jgi:predicted transcriptional regulator of viral defense system